MQSANVTASLSVANKRNRIIRDELLRGIDRFGKQLPARLLTEVLSYVELRDLARSQAVCGGWKLPSQFLNRLWRPLYARQWEAKSAESPDIAVAGPDTHWVERYRRRHQTESNWRAGRWREAGTIELGGYVYSTLLAGSTLFLGCGQLLAVDSNSNAVVKRVDLSRCAIRVLASCESTLLAGDLHGTIFTLTLPELSLEREFKFGSDVYSLASDGKLVVASGWSSYLRIWDLQSGELLRHVELPYGGVWCLAVSWRHNTAYFGNDYSPTLYSLDLYTHEAKPRAVLTILGHLGHSIRALLVDPTSQELYVLTGLEVLALQLPSCTIRARTSARDNWRLTERHGVLVASGSMPGPQLLDKQTLQRFPGPAIPQSARVAASLSKLYAGDETSLRVFDYSPEH